MKFIIDLDGPVLDIHARHMRAYRDAAAATGHAPMADGPIWRIIREGSQPHRLIAGAKPDEVRRFLATLDEALESDEAIAECTAQPDAANSLDRLKRAGSLLLVTLGTNRPARQGVLDALDLSVHFMTMRCLPPEPALRVARLRDLAEGDRRVVVACASEPLARAAQDAGMLPVGIANGAAVEGRLIRAGAQIVFANLEALADEVAGGCNRLIHAGLLPAEHAFGGDPFDQPRRDAPRDRSNPRSPRRSGSGL